MTDTLEEIYAEKVAQAVALLRAMVLRIEDEHGLIGLDALLSTYIDMATEQLGFARTIESLGNARDRISRIYRE